MANTGARLKAYRTLHGLTLEKLALRIGGVHHSQIIRMERGECQPSLPLALAIERETGIKVEDWPNLAAVAEVVERRIAADRQLRAA